MLRRSEIEAENDLNSQIVLERFFTMMMNSLYVSFYSPNPKS